MTAHILHKCDAEDCKICPGNLALCTVCGGAEASMPTECPGVRMSMPYADDVQAGYIDFVGGAWIEKRVRQGSPIPDDVRELLECLIEENAEVIQRVTKALRWGLDQIQPGQPLTNAQRIAEEIGDTYGVERLLVKRGVFTADEIHTAEIRKLEKLKRFLQHASV